MVRIGVLSDTHLNRPDGLIDEIIERHLSAVDMFIHAGDMVCLGILDSLYVTGKPIHAVSGNMDREEVISRYPAKKIIEVEGIRVGIIHGWGSPGGIRQYIIGEFPGVDAIVYGHTHQPFCSFEAGVFFFNPGSPTDSRFTNVNSVGIIVIDSGNMRGEIIGL
jgi:putative phosphoesterase